MKKNRRERERNYLADFQIKFIEECIMSQCEAKGERQQREKNFKNEKVLVHIFGSFSSFIT